MEVEANCHRSVELAYAAGFFDGEGNISIQRLKSRRRGGRDSYKVVAITMNTNRRVLEGLKTEFGGRVYEWRVKGKPTYWQPTFQWHLWGQDFEAFVTAVRPYLRIKAEVADNALAFVALKRAARAAHHRATPPDLLAKMSELYLKHRTLIPTGRPSRVQDVVATASNMPGLGDPE